jgi:hypothetical protein
MDPMMTWLYKSWAAREDESRLARTLWRLSKRLGCEMWMLGLLYRVPVDRTPPEPIEHPSLDTALAGSDEDVYDAATSIVDVMVGEEPSPSVEGVLAHVYYTRGTLSGAGFERLVSGVYEFVEPDFASTIAAYDAIGCPEAAATFRDALALFPGGIPADPEERAVAYLSTDEAAREAVNERFRNEDRNGNIDRGAARYVREHVEVFRRLEEEWQTREEARGPERRIVWK